MKRILTIAALAAVCLSACNKASESTGLQQQDEKVGNVFFAFNNDTRAAVGGADNTINNAQVAVFKGDTQIGYGSKDINAISGTVEIKGLPLGETLDCYAVVNCSESISGKTKAQIAAMTVNLKDFTATKMPMYATGSKSFSKDDKTLSLVLERAASKIEIQKITARFSDALAALDAKVTAIYVYNAPAKYKVSLAAPESQSYYHATGYSSADNTTLGSAATLVAETGLNASIKNNGTYSTAHDFYCCPNAANTTWLTVETSIGGNTYYYGVQMEQLLANYQYIITNAVFTGLGNENPPGIVDNGNISISLTVKDWQTGWSKEVEF